MRLPRKIYFCTPRKSLFCLFFGISLLMGQVRGQYFEARQCTFEGRTYMAVEQYRSASARLYFAVDMETAKEITDSVMARELFLGIRGTNYRAGEPPGPVNYRDIRSFKQIVDREEKTLARTKKEDKKKYITNGVYEPSGLVIHHPATRRYYLFGRFGIYTVPDDNLQAEAVTLIEYPGLVFRSPLSRLRFNPDCLVMEFDMGQLDLRERKLSYRLFDMRKGTFAPIPGMDSLKNMKCLSSLSSPYILFYGWNTNPRDVDRLSLLYNYETGQLAGRFFRYGPPADKYRYELYLHKEQLYYRYYEPSHVPYPTRQGLFGTDLLKGPRGVYEHIIK